MASNDAALAAIEITRLPDTREIKPPEVRWELYYAGPEPFLLHARVSIPGVRQIDIVVDKDTAITPAALCKQLLQLTVDSDANIKAKVK